jgi:hypothetical protein
MKGVFMMKGNGFRITVSSLIILFLLAVASVAALAQQPSHPPAPGEMQFTPMWPTTPLPYSWEIGKHRSQRFGELGRIKPSKEVRKLLKEKLKEEKAQAKKS